MAVAWWWPSSLPAWLGSEAVWFVALNAVVAAVAILSSRARPSLAATTPRRGGGGVTRRASSAVLQSLRSFSLFSFPSACMSFLQPDAAAYQETDDELVRALSPTNKPPPSPRALVLAPPPPVPAAAEKDVDDNEEEDEDPNAMSMDEAYALVLASRQRSEVDAKAEEFIRRFKEDQRQQRLNSIFNYTQMLKQRGLAAGRRPPDARPDQL